MNKTKICLFISVVRIMNRKRSSRKFHWLLFINNVHWQHLLLPHLLFGDSVTSSPFNNLWHLILLLIQNIKRILYASSSGLVLYASASCIVCFWKYGHKEGKLNSLLRALQILFIQISSVNPLDALVNNRLVEH